MSMVFSEIPYESNAFFPLMGCFETVKYSLDELLFFVSCETEKKLHEKIIVISLAVDFFLLILLQPGSMQLFQPCLFCLCFLSRVDLHILHAIEHVFYHFHVQKGFRMEDNCQWRVLHAV